MKHLALLAFIFIASTYKVLAQRDIDKRSMIGLLISIKRIHAHVRTADSMYPSNAVLLNVTDLDTHQLLRITVDSIQSESYKARLLGLKDKTILIDVLYKGTYKQHPSIHLLEADSAIHLLKPTIMY